MDNIGAAGGKRKEMNCPVCEERLRPIDKMGVEVDICPGCKGVWLDRGELEKLLDLAGSERPAPQNAPQTSKVEFRREDDRDDRDKDRKDNREIDPRTGKPKRRESWFSELFDGFGD